MKEHDVDNDCKEDEDIHQYNDEYEDDTNNNCEEAKNVEEYHDANKGSRNELIHDNVEKENPTDLSFIIEEAIFQLKNHDIPIHGKVFEINRSTQPHYLNIKTKI